MNTKRTPKRTPIDGAPVLPEGYFYRVKHENPVTSRSELYWVYVQIRKVTWFGSWKVGQGSCVYRVSRGNNQLTSIRTLAKEAYRDAYIPVPPVEVPQELRDYLGDHHVTTPEVDEADAQWLEENSA